MLAKKKMMTNFSSSLDKKISFQTKWFSKKFKEAINKHLISYPEKYKKIVFYSLFPGGKRIRPVLMFATGEMLDVDIEDLLYPAFSIELIHNYSLIHDDLPSMDNDDYRRGKLTVHKRFGEANAILTGDGLLTLAFEILTDWKTEYDVFIKVLKLISSSSGFTGLIKGQIMDLESNKILKCNNKFRVSTYLQEMVLNKTAKLIETSILVPAIVKKVDKDKFKILSDIGRKIGMLFQITDDLIDYISKQDKNTLTYPVVYGEEKTKQIIDELTKKIVTKIVQNFNKEKSGYLIYLVNKISTRKN